MAKPFSIGALGGTFDHFHAGHQLFLDFASTQAEHLVIGVTAQSFTESKQFASTIEPFEVRSEAVKNFCLQRQISFEIVELTDQFGPTLGQRQIDCLIVTELTKDGGEVLNQERANRGLSPLPVQVSKMFIDQSGEVLSSTRIREGVVSRQGSVYAEIFTQDFEFTEVQKQGFKDPWGEIVEIPAQSSSDLIAVVGDRCSENFLQNAWKYHFLLYDLLEQRQPNSGNMVPMLTPHEVLANPSGGISSQVVAHLQKQIKIFTRGNTDNHHLCIEGEEDLLAVALFLLLPLKSLVYYGQPGIGMIEVKVSEDVKEKAFDILK